MPSASKTDDVNAASVNRLAKVSSSDLISTGFSKHDAGLTHRHVISARDRSSSTQLQAEPFPPEMKIGQYVSRGCEALIFQTLLDAREFS